MPSSTELFLDDELIEMTASVTRRIHQPTKYRLNPILRPKQWWEGNCIMPLATLYDPEEKLFKTWYRTGPLDNPEEADRAGRRSQCCGGQPGEALEGASRAAH